MTFGVKRNSPRRVAPDATDAQSQEALRVRARRRLIGAVALVLLGVIVFPLVFESRPKPVPSNIHLDIPSQTKAPALTLPASAPAPAGASSPVATAAGHASAARAASAVAASVPATAPVPIESAAGVQPKVGASAAPPEPAPPARVAPGPAATEGKRKPPAAPARPEPPAQAQTKAIAGARNALAALEGKSPAQISVAQAEAALAHGGQPATDEAAPSKARFVVQAGAFADAHAAQAVRARIEKAGLRTYTQVVDTAQGKRIRVRVGPFPTRDAAEQALAKLRRLGLSGAVLTL